MPATYSVYPDQDLLVINYSGTLTVNCVLQFIDQIEADPDHDDALHELNDLRAVEKMAITRVNMEKIAGLVSGFSHRGPRSRRKALVASSDLVHRACVVYAGELGARSDIDVRVFREMDEALRFLDLESSPIAEELIGAPLPG